MPDEQPTPLRDRDEIQRAHYMLWAVLMGEVPAPQNLDKMVTIPTSAMMSLQLEVLCWVLHHDHSVAFADNLHNLERFLAENDIGSINLGRPRTHITAAEIAEGLRQIAREQREAERRQRAERDEPGPDQPPSMPRMDDSHRAPRHRRIDRKRRP